EKVKSDNEGTLKEGVGGGQVVDNVITAGEIGGIGVTVAILAGLAKSDGGIGSLGGAAAGGAAGVGRKGGTRGPSVPGQRSETGSKRGHQIETGQACFNRLNSVIFHTPYNI